MPMTVGQLEDLMERLDTNKDGIVDLKYVFSHDVICRVTAIFSPFPQPVVV